MIVLEEQMPQPKVFKKAIKTPFILCALKLYTDVQFYSGTSGIKLKKASQKAPLLIARICCIILVM
jgi:hypothetical protein